MNLTETPESIVPGQSEIDSWPQLKRTSHPCQDKYLNFVDEQCCHCLIQDQNEPISDEQKFIKRAIESIEEIS